MNLSEELAMKCIDRLNRAHINGKHQPTLIIAGVLNEALERAAQEAERINEWR